MSVQVYEGDGVDKSRTWRVRFRRRNQWDDAWRWIDNPVGSVRGEEESQAFIFKEKEVAIDIAIRILKIEKSDLSHPWYAEVV